MPLRSRQSRPLHSPSPPPPGFRTLLSAFLLLSHLAYCLLSLLAFLTITNFLVKARSVTQTWASRSGEGLCLLKRKRRAVPVPCFDTRFQFMWAILTQNLKNFSYLPPHLQNRDNSTFLPHNCLLLKYSVKKMWKSHLSVLLSTYRLVDGILNFEQFPKGLTNRQAQEHLAFTALGSSTLRSRRISALLFLLPLPGSAGSEHTSQFRLHSTCWEVLLPTSGVVRCTFLFWLPRGLVP